MYTRTGKHSAYLLLTALLLVCQLGASAQAVPAAAPAARLRAVYQLDYKLDSVVTTPKRVRMTLRVSNGVSRFQSAGRQLLDSVYASLTGVGEQERLQKSLDATWKGGKNEFQYTILKEPAKNYVSYHDGIGSQDHQYVEKGPLFAWRITPQKKTIAGHECQQAFAQYGGRMWEAWFARDVPVSDGPYKFYGLPGLILQVRDTHDNYTFSLLCLDTNPQPFDAAADPGSPISAKSSAPVIPKAQFVQAKYNDELTFVDRMVAGGNQVPESLRQNHLQMIKRRNNPLERK